MMTTLPNIPYDISNKHLNIERLLPVPPTPKPRSVNEIQTDAKERFKGMLYMEYDDKIPIEKIFSEYDHWEEYDESKPYSKRKYQASYNGLMREYQSYLCCLNMGDSDKYYVFAKRVPNELDDLIPYCPCYKCKASIFNPMKYIWCNYCTKCIRTGPGFCSLENINIAKELKIQYDNKKNITYKYQKYIPKNLNISNIKYLELFALLILILSYFILLK